MTAQATHLWAATVDTRPNSHVLLVVGRGLRFQSKRYEYDVFDAIPCLATLYLSSFTIASPCFSSYPIATPCRCRCYGDYFIGSMCDFTSGIHVGIPLTVCICVKISAPPICAQTRSCRDASSSQNGPAFYGMCLLFQNHLA